MQRLFTPSFLCVNAMQNICELYAKAIFIIPRLFPGYLNTKKTNQKLFSQLFPIPFYYVISISVVCEGYLFSMLGLFKCP